MALFRDLRIVLIYYYTLTQVILENGRRGPSNNRVVEICTQSLTLFTYYCACTAVFVLIVRVLTKRYYISDILISSNNYFYVAIY